jgi:hypothetical protein
MQPILYLVRVDNQIFEVGADDGSFIEALAVSH